ncbi:hypothetical protein ACNKHX_02495 [Shigella flexneri]
MSQVALQVRFSSADHHSMMPAQLAAFWHNKTKTIKINAEKQNAVIVVHLEHSHDE